MSDAARRLVLLRHGRTAWNLVARSQGHADIPLDEVGHAEAAAVAPVLARLRPTRLWSSDLSRALQTASYVAEATGLPVVQDSRLREYDLGSRSGLTPPEFAATFPAEHAAWLAGDSSLVVEGEETGAQVRARLEPVLRDCFAALGQGETGIAVLHGGCVKDGLFALLGWPAELSRTIRGMDNCGWVIVAEGLNGAPTRLESYNETTDPGPHLADFASDGPVG